MPDYDLREIYRDNERSMNQLDALLEKEGIRRDQNLEYIIGLFDEGGRLAATGACFGNTLRCMAVDAAHQGEGLLNRVVEALVNHQCRRGNTDLFLLTKCDTARFFQQLGFYEIARAGGQAVLMENRKDKFRSYLHGLAAAKGPGTQGAVVMNANPFTLGHQYLLEQASAACGTLHVFVVSEDVSLIPFAVRETLVREGSRHLSNLVYHPTGSYLISNATFPSYFLQDQDAVTAAHARLDVSVFQQIARAMDITVRFVGEEPFSRVTGIYNRILLEELPPSGVQCLVLPRKTAGGRPISASDVRLCLKNGAFDILKTLVPESTYRYFISEAAQPILKKLHECPDVVHG